MATSKTIRKNNFQKHFNKFCKNAYRRDYNCRKWIAVKHFHNNTLLKLLFREVETRRIRNKLIFTDDYENIRPFANSWAIPILCTNPAKRSRIKNITNFFRSMKAHKIIAPDGNPYTQNELLNLYYAKGKREEL